MVKIFTNERILYNFIERYLGAHANILRNYDSELFVKSPGRYSQLTASEVEYPAANHLDLITFGLIVPSLTKLVSLFFTRYLILW
jgi:hypothetical protein